MPCVNVGISGLSLNKKLMDRLVTELTSTIQDEVSNVFPLELGYVPGTPEFEVARKVAHRIMPGMIWVNLADDDRWAINGQQACKAIAVRVQIMLLAGSLLPRYRQQIARAIACKLEPILGHYGKPLHFLVNVFEGEVDMTLPPELFGDLLKGSNHALLTLVDVVQFVQLLIAQELEPDLPPRAALKASFRRK